MPTPPFIEPLEARIAPAAVLTLTDVDGDLVTIKTSKGTNADLAAVVTTSMPAGSVPGGVAIDTINLAANAIFDGTNLSVTAKPGPLGGDGLVNVASITALGLDLGTVKIGGDLQNLDAGKNSVASRIKTIDVQSTSGIGVWRLDGNVGTLKVARDLRGAEIDLLVPGTTLGSLQIGGSLIGETALKTGFINVPNGTIGKIAIKGSILGGTGESSGAIAAKDILAVSIGGGIFGDAEDSGKIAATGMLGPITIKGGLHGGAGFGSGRIEAATIASITLGGSIVGSSGADTGVIFTTGDPGPVTIKGDVRGGTLSGSGQVMADGDLASITIRGSLIGGSSGFETGSIQTTGKMGPVKIARDIIGGARSGSGSISAIGGIASLTVGGSLLGGTESDSGLVNAFSSDIGPVKIAGSIIGGTGSITAEIRTIGKIGNVTIGGDMRSGDNLTSGIFGGKGIGAVKIAGSMLGGRIVADAAPGSQLAVKSLTIGGRVEDAFIFSLGPDSQFGPVKVGGNWIASNLYTGIDTGADLAIGTADDVVTTMGANDPALFSKIASITIGGQVKGTVGGTDHFGFVSQEIGSLKINGVKVPLTPGRGNDTNVNDTRFILGATRDVTVHEVV